MPNEVQTLTLFHTLVHALIAGLPNLPASVTALSVQNQTFTPAALGTQLSTLVAPYDAVVKAEQELAAAEATVGLTDKQTRKFVMAVVRALKTALGNTSPSLKNLGIQPDQVPQAPPAAKRVAAAAKGQATKKARGTNVGKRQRAQIHGEVPAAAPAAASAASAAPAKTGS